MRHLTACKISVSLLFLNWIWNKWFFIESLNQCCLQIQVRETNSNVIAFKVHPWTFTTPWANSAYDKLVIVSYFFSENRLWHFIQIVSGEKLHEMYKPIFWENKKYISKCCLLKFLPRMLSVKTNQWLYSFDMMFFNTCPAEPGYTLLL